MIKLLYAFCCLCLDCSYIFRIGIYNWKINLKIFNFQYLVVQFSLELIYAFIDYTSGFDKSCGYARQLDEYYNCFLI